MVLDTFDHAYYINLDRRTDRRKHMEEMLAFMGIEAERVSAFERKEEGDSEWGYINRSMFGMYGCTRSHLMVLENALEKKYSNVLILEDDIVPTEAWSCCHHVLEKLRQTEWSMFYFFGKQTEGRDKLISRVFKAPWLTHAYAVNGNTIEGLISFINATKGGYNLYPIDGIYRMYPSDKIFCSSLDLVVQEELIKSDSR